MARTLARSRQSTEQLGASKTPVVVAHEADDALLLHLIRILALHLFVCLSRSVSTSLEDLELLVTADTSGETGDYAERLDAALVAWVQREMAGNQFDGLLHEHRAFLLIRKFFRHNRVAGATQLRVLASLLATYMEQLQVPLVACEPSTVLRSTLEYLLSTGTVLGAVSPSILYPLVFAVDSLRIEQRDCLEALTTLLKRLSDCGSSDMIASKLISRFHRNIIHVSDVTDDSTSGVTAMDAAPTSIHLHDLGICFVRTLLCHSDHIFRRDPEFPDIPAFFESETEDEDFSEDSPDVPSARKELDDCPEVESRSSADSTDAVSSSAETEDGEDDGLASAPFPAENCQPQSTKRSIRKRKKRVSPPRNLPSQQSQPTQPSCVPLPAPVPVAMPLTCKAELDESYSSTVALAAAAGTLAAVLCVIFT